MSDTQVLRERLAECLRRVPDGVNSGSYQTAVKFKDFVAEAKMALTKRNTSERTFLSLISRYEGFK